METTRKNQIAEKLKSYTAQFNSQNQAARSLKGVSSALISQIKNDRWDKISDEMWRNIASQIGYESDEWQFVETQDYQLITALLQDAQQYSNVFAAVGEAGSGKTIAMKNFAREHRNAHLLQCNEYWNRKYFLAELLQAMGRDYSGLTVSDMMMEVTSQLKMQEAPIIIMDEADKLSDQVLYFFITIYNQLENHCGIVMMATDHLQKRIKKGLRLNKKGYKEIYSRIGRKCIELKGVSQHDVHNVCVANGLTDHEQIKMIKKEAQGDLRRVNRKIHAIRKKQHVNNDQ